MIRPWGEGRELAHGSDVWLTAEKEGWTEVGHQPRTGEVETQAAKRRRKGVRKSEIRNPKFEICCAPAYYHNRLPPMEHALTPLLVILGPTGSGKSRLGLEVAEQIGGEIVSADAFAVYRGLDIGTDKPTSEDRHRVRHHLVDVADPRHRFSAGEFAEAATASIDDIVGRGRTAIVVGGTHFYIRALLEGLFPSSPRDPAHSEKLAEDWERDPGSVYQRLQEVDPEAAERIAPRDRQRVLRALEIYQVTGETLTSHWQRHQHSSAHKLWVQ